MPGQFDLTRSAARLREFAELREFDQFQDPKSLIMALTGEVGELAALFQWLTAEESRSAMADPELSSRVLEEVADVQIYLVRLVQELGFDLSHAVMAKIDQNNRKYPIDLSRGSRAKYTELIQGE